MNDIVSLNIAGWLAVAAFLVMLVNGSFKLARNVKGSEPLPPNNVLGQRVAAIEQHSADHEAEDRAEVARLESQIAAVDRDVKELRKEINTNGELRKNHMIAHIDDVRRELDRKIEAVARAQTEQLLKAINR